MSIDEIEDKILSFERSVKRSMKNQAVLNGVLADQIYIRITKMFDDKNEIEIKHLWDYFPSLFIEEKKHYEEEKEIEEFEAFKSARRAFAVHFNKNRKGE